MLIAHLRTRFMEAFLPRLSEWVAAGTVLLLGVALHFNEGLMTPDKRGYQAMLEWFDQEAWSRILIIFSVARLSILVINGAWRRSPHWRAVSAFCACFLWAQIVLSFMPITGFAFCLAFGFLTMDIINVIRAARDARVVDDEYRKADRSAGAQ